MDMYDNIEQHSESTVLVFTDGSVCNGPVGSGACVAVVLPHCANKEIFTMTGAVGTKVNSLVCEVNGIIHRLEIGIKRIHYCKEQKQIKSICVFSDCDSAINTVVSISELNTLKNCCWHLHMIITAVKKLIAK